MTGRAMLEEGPIEAWIAGVAPVGLAGGGIGRNVAFAEFRRAWVEILFDIANEAKSFADFRERFEEFLGSSQESLTREWEVALDEVRRTKFVDPTLKRAPAHQQRVCFEVVELVPASGVPDANQVEAGLLAAA